MHKNPRDVHGDGHGFVDVPVGRPSRASQGDEHKRFNRDLRQMPLNKDHPFVGLYAGPHGVLEVRLVIRADKPHRGLRLLSYENSHYMTDPIAFYEIPSWDDVQP